VIAGTASGVGKTTVTAGIMGALRRRGLNVAPFKAGPDYIDPGYHQAAAGRMSRNLDTWLTSADGVRENFLKGAAGADISIIEGVMGLFDGRAGAGDGGSTAEIARLVDGVVILVVDCSSMSRSLAALLQGFAAFDPGLEVAGVILNNVGSERHRMMLVDAAREAGMPVMGAFMRQPELAMASRHLGLVPAGEGDREELLEAIIAAALESLDLDRLLELASPVEGIASGIPAEHRRGPEEQVRLAVGRDEAFGFYYADGLEALEAAGAVIDYFSPLRDSELPACDGIYLGGGFPEVFATRLAENGAMRAAIAEAAASGMPVYAECGGLVYLCRDVEVSGNRVGMVGAVPLRARMTERRQALGYVEATVCRDSVLFDTGEKVRGHEFHWSDIDWQDDRLAYDCFSARREGVQVDGFCEDNILASYVHINFAGNRGAAERFVNSCRKAKGALTGAA
jgi:cobyrinic acid a,c-diamide synthase